MNEEKSIANIKVKTSDLCIKCGKELKAIKLGGDMFSMSTGTGAFYCENNNCEFFGYLTLGRVPHSEKVVELSGEEAKTQK